MIDFVFECVASKLCDYFGIVTLLIHTRIQKHSLSGSPSENQRDNEVNQNSESMSKLNIILI